MLEVERGSLGFRLVPARSSDGAMYFVEGQLGARAFEEAMPYRDGFRILYHEYVDEQVLAGPKTRDVGTRALANEIWGELIRDAGS